MACPAAPNQAIQGARQGARQGCGGWRPRTCARESLRECAGSVDTTSVVCPAAASLIASDADRLVLPTPPLPGSEREEVGAVGAAGRRLGR